MPWPLSQDYNEAIQSPQTSFGDAELRGGEVTVNAMGLPQPCSGNFADVYRFNCASTGRTWAVKCFTRQIPGLRERYQQISLFLKQLKLPFMVDFTFLDQGIRIRGDWYPILKMEWAEGQPLNQFVKNHLDKPQMLQRLCQIWVKLASRLREANFAHCDLQHGNVLLVPGSKAGMLGVKLVDYDGMCVPSLTMLKSLEVGHPSYQHPQRQREGIFNLEVDRFAHLVIYTALRSLLIGGKSLWERYDNGDNMLFCQNDFKAPGKSALFKELLQSPDAELRRLAQVVQEAAQQPMERTPLLADIARDERVAEGAPATKATRGKAPVFAVSAVPQVPMADEAAIDESSESSTERPRRIRGKSVRKRQFPLAVVGLVGAVLLFFGGLAAVAVALWVFVLRPSVDLKNKPDIVEIDFDARPAKAAKAKVKDPPNFANPDPNPVVPDVAMPDAVKPEPVKQQPKPPIPAADESKIPPEPERKIPLPPMPPDPKVEVEDKAQWIDLIDIVDPEMHRIQGTWRREGAHLIGEGSDFGRLQIPYCPPEEYLLRITVEKARELHIGLALPQSQVLVGINCYASSSSGMMMVDGKGMLENSFRHDKIVGADGKPVTVLCAVHKDSLKVDAGGQTIIDWQGDLNRLDMPPNWWVPNPGSLVISCGINGARITKMEIKPISGNGKFLTGMSFDGAGAKEKKTATHYRLLGTEWITSNNVIFCWNNLGVLWWDGTSRRYDVISDTKVNIGGPQQPPVTLLFDNMLTHFEQKTDSKSKVGSTFIGTRLDPADWRKVSIWLKANGKGKLMLSDKGMSWQNITGTFPAEVKLGKYSWHPDQKPILEREALINMLGGEVDIRAGRVLSIPRGPEAMPIERDKTSTAIVFDPKGKPGGDTFSIVAIFPVGNKSSAPAVPIRSFVGHSASVNDIALHPDGLHFVSGGEDKIVRFWDIKTGKEQWRTAFNESPVNAVWCSHAGGDAWGGSTGKLSNSVMPQLKYKNTGGLIGIPGTVLYPIQQTPDDKYILYCCSTKDYRKALIATGMNTRTPIHADSPLDAYVLAWSADSKLVLTTGEDKTVRVSAVEVPNTLAVFSRNMVAEAGAFSPNSKQVAACGKQSNVIVLWDTSTAKVQAKSTAGKGTAPIHALSFSSDGRRLLSGHDDGTVRLWDTGTLKEIYKLKCSPVRINRALFLPDGRSALVAGADGSIGLWALPK